MARFAGRSRGLPEASNPSSTLGEPSSGRTWLIGWSSSSFLCSTSCMQAVAVMALVMDSSQNTVSCVMTAAPARSRLPVAPSKITPRESAASAMTPATVPLETARASASSTDLNGPRSLLRGRTGAGRAAIVAAPNNERAPSRRKSRRLFSSMTIAMAFPRVGPRNGGDARNEASLSKATSWHIIRDSKSRVAMALDGRVLSNVSVLAAVVKGGSFVRAAEALGLTPSGVSRAIARLEARIGVRLLDRTTRSLPLTYEGRRLDANINPLVLGIEDAVTRTAGSAGSVRGRLRVNTDAFTSRLLLSPHIGRFLDLYAELSLELIARDQLGDLVAEGFGIAVRFGEPPSSSLVARKLLDTRIVTVATPSYLKRHGRPAKPADLANHVCIQVRSPLTGQPFPWEFRRGRRVIEVPTSGRLLLTDVGTILGTCLSGVGVAQIKALGIQELLDDGKLIDLFPDWPDERFPLYALYPSRHLPAAKVRAFIDFVMAAIEPKAGGPV